MCLQERHGFCAFFAIFLVDIYFDAHERVFRYYTKDTLRGKERWCAGEGNFIFFKALVFTVEGSIVVTGGIGEGGGGGAKRSESGTFWSTLHAHTYIYVYMFLMPELHSGSTLDGSVPVGSSQSLSGRCRLCWERGGVSCFGWPREALVSVRILRGGAQSSFFFARCTSIPPVCVFFFSCWLSWGVCIICVESSPVRRKDKWFGCLSFLSASMYLSVFLIPAEMGLLV